MSNSAAYLLVGLMVTACEKPPSHQLQMECSTQQNDALKYHKKSLIEIAARGRELNGCYVKTSGYLRIDEGTYLFFSPVDYSEFNSFNAIELHNVYADEHGFLRPPLQGISLNDDGKLVIVEGAVESMDGYTRIKDVNSIWRYGILSGSSP
jgi:hypothetical protein